MRTAQCSSTSANVTTLAPHTAKKLTACGKLTFDARLMKISSGQYLGEGRGGPSPRRRARPAECQQVDFIQSSNRGATPDSWTSAIKRSVSWSAATLESAEAAALRTAQSSSTSAASSTSFASSHRSRGTHPLPCRLLITEFVQEVSPILEVSTLAKPHTHPSF